MKKKYGIFLILLALALSGCGREAAPTTEKATTGAATETTTQATTEEATEETTQMTEPPTTTEPYVPEISPDVIGIYIPAGDGTRARERITEFSAKRTAKADIDCFEIFAAEDERLEGSSFSAIWKAAWEAHETDGDPKIGFLIEFQLPDGDAFSKQLLKPSDSGEFFDFIEIYMYDDVHQSGGWYTHLSDGDMTEETVITSIKLTAGSRIAEVGDILLTAFIYDGDDCFDAAGDYIGQVSQTVLITE